MFSAFSGLLLGAICLTVAVAANKAHHGRHATNSRDLLTLTTFSVGANPSFVAVDLYGDIWVTNYEGDTVSVLSSTGTLQGTYSVGSGPGGVAIDKSGNAWITNEGSNSVTKLSNSGTVSCC